MSPNSLSALSDDSAGRLDLTPAQRGIWYAQQLAPENPMYQIGQFVEILGPLDAGVLAAPWRRRSRGRMPSTGSSARTTRDRSRRRSGTRPGWTSRISAGAADPEAEARALMDADLGLPRDVRADELLHTELIRLSGERHFFYQRVHHLMLDGYSAVLVLKRVAASLRPVLTGTAQARTPDGTEARRRNGFRVPPGASAGGTGLRGAPAPRRRTAPTGKQHSVMRRRPQDSPVARTALPAP